MSQGIRGRDMEAKSVCMQVCEYLSAVSIAAYASSLLCIPIRLLFHC